MKNVIFVHGAYHAGWCWDEVIKLLPKEKFASHPIDLPANGSNNSFKKENVDIEEYVNYVIDYIISNHLTEVILVSHSLGGITISKVIEKIPEKIDEAFFITSVILNNKNFISFLPAEVQEKYRQIASSRPDKSIPPNLEKIRQILFSSSPDSKELTNFLSRLEPQPIRPYEEIIELTSIKNSSVPMTYVKCKNDTSLPKETFDEMVSYLPDYINIKTIEADHEAMFSNPKAIADLLLR
jgi:pimeloyl-ACP methyl ester carboxylesterase